MSNPLLYFLHGWGYSKDFWQKTASYLPKERIILADAGYFGASTSPLPQDDYLAIGHSLGFMMLLPQIITDQKALGLLGINSFACFGQKEDFKEGISPRILMRMQRNLERNPNKTLRDFYKMCGDSREAPPIENLCLEALQEGLKKLLQADKREDFKTLETSHKILSTLSGDNDPLAPAKIRWMPRQTNITGGHLLPLTHPECCAAWIQKHLEFLKSS